MTQSNLNYGQRKGIEFYIKDPTQKEVYIRTEGHERYAFDYIQKRERLAKDENNQEYYCKRDDNEIYPVFLDTGFHRLTIAGEKQIYARDKYGNEKYPLNRYRKEKLAKLDMTQRTCYYARDANQDEFYPRDDLRNDWVHKVNNLYVVALTHDSKPKAPLLRDGRVGYEKENSRQMLYRYDNTPFFGEDVSGNEVYPLDENGDEYYPLHDSRPMIARDASGKYRYALSHLHKIRYPRDPADQEHYLENFVGDLRECALEDQAEHFERYVASDRYPERVVDAKGRSTELLIRDTLLPHRYPVDANGNEFTNASGTILESLGYPITHDHLVILPNVNNAPVTLPGDGPLSKRIHSLLYRPSSNTYDFLTDVVSPRKSVHQGAAYKVLKLSDYKMDTSQTDYYIVGGLVLLISILLIFICCR